MRVPIMIEVGGRKITIEYPMDIDNGHSAGEMVCGEHKIRVARSKHKNEREVFATLFHELVHYALELTGHSAAWKKKTEEPIVYGLENMLSPIFLFNPLASIKYRDVKWPKDDE